MTSGDLVAANHPALFWRFEPRPPAEAWDAALETLASEFEEWRALVHSAGWTGLLAWILAEEQFGPDRYRLSPAKRAYYALKPILPRSLTRLARQAYRTTQARDFPLAWPSDPRYARFMVALRDAVAEAHPGATPTPLWPEGRDWALVLTHDVESARGRDFVSEVADLEERLGYRSSFNFVPERYAQDDRLMGQLRERGFEVGVHGLRHDGHLFASRSRFQRRARRINRYLEDWRAAGFRSPLTHRNPHWMQALDIEYDASFFDTDPFEPMPGGVLSIWPYFLGRFVELPYTLVQDYTLLNVMGEKTPAVWLEKARTIRAHGGMVLLNTHPDYLLAEGAMEVYAGFLEGMSGEPGGWPALPVEAARWWRTRAAAAPGR